MESVVIALTVLLCVVPRALEAAGNAPQVTCGTLVKLQHVKTGVRLHSHEVTYGSGSGQQSVTGNAGSDDVNSYWSVSGPKEANSSPCKRGEPIKCNGKIRLRHSTTNRHLHSHHFQSPLSNNQEVSAYGDKEHSDTGDNWQVVCSGKVWRKDTKVQLKHVDTDKYLYVQGATFGHPIAGQFEVSAFGSSSPDTHWKAMEGVFIKPTKK
ncbi:stromal cell-derived factor 2-like [Sycon ciliatum]|uniref:stromal cell-derived factor 2-like n=1 Tax=Sycon ciliatum TaxID=27933 RepID=UPI0020ACEEDC|eukprot:scpid83535/ scgid20298/ Stromal cell-derived factor 2